MAVNTATELDAAAKQLYKDANYHEEFLEDRVLYGMIPKDTSFGGAASTGQLNTVAGRGMPIVIRYGRTGGASRTFADAQTVATLKESEVGAFQFRHVNDYSIFEVDGESLDLNRGAEFNWISVLQMAMDDAAETLSDKLEMFSYRTGGGSKAQIKSVAGTGSSDWTLNDKQDIVLFDFNEVVDVADENASVTANKPGDSGTYRSRDTAANATIDSLDLDDGILSVVDNAALGAVAGDFVYSYGDAQHNAGLTVKIDGLAAWCPNDVASGVTDPLAVKIGSSTDLFRGLDRSASYKLHGAYFDQSAMSIETALTRGQERLALRNGKPKVAIVPQDQYRKLNEDLGIKREYCDVNAMGERGLVANVNYGGVFVHGLNGSMKVIPASFAPAKRAWLIDPKDFVLFSSGPAVSLMNRDGLSILRESDDDAYQGRFVFRGNLVCRKPGRQAQLKLAAV